MAVKHHAVRQLRSKKNPGATLDAPYFLDDSKGSGSVQGTATSKPTQRRHSTRTKKG